MLDGQKNFVGVSPVEGFGLFLGEACKEGDLVEECVFQKWIFFRAVD